MKLIISLFIVGISLSSFIIYNKTNATVSLYNHMNQKLYSSGALAGYTGAPGEQNCTACHSGTVQDGSSENLFTIQKDGVDALEYIPNETYDLHLEMASDPAKKGFEIIVLNEVNQFVGSFTAGSNTQIKNGSGGKKYITHTSGTNSPNGWDWTWTAPSSIQGELTFYMATNKTNANNSASGDVIYLSQFSFSTSVGIAETESIVTGFSAGFSPTNNTLFIDFESEIAGEMSLNIVDLNGKSIMNKPLGKSTIGANNQSLVLSNTISPGIYVVNFFIDNNVRSQKIMIQ